ncbi:nucleotidyltransferase [Clostridium fermenticellae]|uniref:tRNA(Met) cytidine acetate ligase n=1 Tax=Clostridium fermenticellae TaxID=2068654 RepID=A0A386H2X7_9CLOT|nr:nucleotidyltransferase [Clostridium fermenticellae]AYD40030.1 nucleotidyltransferase [Clostridium fermenticellae]
MNVTGIIVEFNPPHKGHIYHIKKTREICKSDGIVAIMSGNFVQRGEPALIDKWNRTEMALKNGVDLVLELPVVYSLSSAEFFAYGALSLLDSIGTINNICFGSELGKIEPLISIAKILSFENNEYKILLKHKLSLGLSYPGARNKALIEFLNNHNTEYPELNNINLDNLLQASNNILGIEYCKNILKLKSSIKPFTIKRIGEGYNSTSLNQDISSATAIRNYIKNFSSLGGLKKFLPDNVYYSLENLKKNQYEFVFSNSILKYIKYKYFLDGTNYIKNIPDVSEGIENRIFKFLNEATSLKDLIDKSKTKRYTYTRISRILCQFFIGFEKWNTDFIRKSKCSYARVLGFNKTGLKILKEMKSNSAVPIYTKLPNNINDSLAIDVQSTKVYSLINKNINAASDYLISPIKYI